MNSFWRKLRWVTQRDKREAELREELEFHLEEEAEQLREEGLADEEARWTARRELGNPTLVQENTRAIWVWIVIEQLGQDLRYAFRNIAGNRLFTLLAVLLLALGIGVNVAIFSFMDSILLRSLPVPDPESLVVLNWHAKETRHDSVLKSMHGSIFEDPKGGAIAGIFPFAAFELVKKQSSIFSSVFAHYRESNLNLAINGQAELAHSWTVSGEYFGGLGIAPAAGRLIIPDDDRAGAQPVAVVSYGLSERRFGGTANAVGQTALINGLPFTIVGVTPPEFFGVDPAAAQGVYLPLHANELLGASDPFGFRPQMYLDANAYWLQIMARLRPGVTRAQAQHLLAPLFHRWVASTATNEKERANLPRLVVKEGAGGLDSLRRQYSKPLYVLLTLVGLILVLACANVANLLLARGAARKGEIALRLSLGASRRRVVRQLLTESILLGTLGGTTGVAFALCGIHFLTRLLVNGEGNSTLHAELNWHVLGVVAGLSLLTSILFGLVPALDATRVDVMPALKATSGAQAQTRHISRVQLRHLLLVGQIAVSLLMLVAAGLFVRTLLNLQAIELGFNRENLLLFQVDARKAGHKDPEIVTFYGGLRNRLSAIPGVRKVTLESGSPITGEDGEPISVAGSKPNPANRYLIAGPGYFATMQIPILAGRDFRESDRRGAPAVAVVNQIFAKTNLGNRNPLGQRLLLQDEDKIVREMEIVGVSKNARYGGLTNVIPPVVYMPYDQGYPQPNQMVYALRTSGDPLQYVSSVRAIVRQSDPRIPVSEVRTQVAEIDHLLNQEIMFADLCSAFALLALTIASVGLYGAVSYDVSRRTGEIGIRMALGAQRSAVVRMVLREVLVIAVLGLASGLGVALATSKFLEAFLYRMKSNDPLALTFAAVTLLSAALVAGYVPAWRASRINPLTAIRHE